MPGGERGGGCGWRGQLGAFGALFFRRQGRLLSRELLWLWPFWGFELRLG